MYNSNIPSNEDLPSTGKLIKSTILAAIGAGVLLVTVVMPSEYGIDPTGAGKLLGLTEMGEIKQSLVLEAEADAEAHAPAIEEPSHDDHGHDDHDHKPKGHHHGDGSYHHH
jgi:ABC-type Zn2+ transport system substrate-binding protein/surface adhesin